MPLLASLLVLTDGQSTRGRPLVEVLAAAIDGGARALLLREKHLSRPARAALADRIRPLLDAVDGTLLVASDATITAQGVHLAATDSIPRPVPAILGRSCHAPAAVAAAAREGCTYATLSPVFASPSKPGYGPALGPAAFADLGLPTWALGGVDVTNAAACLQGGAAGVAVMGTVMRSPDPAAVVAAMLAEMGT